MRTYSPSANFARRQYRRFAAVCSCLLLSGLLSLPVGATEIYHWVDENGVAHYSQTAPESNTLAVQKLQLQEDTADSGSEDIYHLEAQAERMQAYRDGLADSRAANREAREKARPKVVYQPYEVVRYGGYPYGRGGWGGWRPPLKPVHPIAPPPAPDPYPIVKLRPLSSGN